MTISVGQEQATRNAPFSALEVALESADSGLRVTFARHPTVAACVGFAAYYCLYYVFALLLLRVLVDHVGVDEHYAPIVMLPIVVPINFVVTRFIVHRFGRALT